MKLFYITNIWYARYDAIFGKVWKTSVGGVQSHLKFSKH